MFYLDEVKGFFNIQADFVKTKDEKGVEILLEDLAVALEFYPDEDKKVKQVNVRSYIDTAESLLLFERAKIPTEYPSLAEVQEVATRMADEALSYVQEMIVCNFC